MKFKLNIKALGIILTVLPWALLLLLLFGRIIPDMRKEKGTLIESDTASTATIVKGSVVVDNPCPDSVVAIAPAIRILRDTIYYDTVVYRIDTIVKDYFSVKFYSFNLRQMGIDYDVSARLTLSQNRVQNFNLDYAFKEKNVTNVNNTYLRDKYVSIFVGGGFTLWTYPLQVGTQIIGGFNYNNNAFSLSYDFINKGIGVQYCRNFKISH